MTPLPDHSQGVAPGRGSSATVLLVAHNWLNRIARPQYALAYGAQLVSFLTALSFNLVVPVQVGATVYGGFVAASSLSFSLFAVLAPGYSLAAVRHVAPFGGSADDHRLLLRWLMVPASVAAMGVILLCGPVGLDLLNWSGAASVYTAALIQVLSATHLLDCLLVAQNRNGLSLFGRLVVAVGVGILPSVLAKIHHSSASVLLGVLLAYLIGMSVYVQILTRSEAHPSTVGKVHTLRLNELISSSVHYSAISMTSTLFSWATLLIVSRSVTPEALAGLKIALAVPTAVVAVLPFPQMFIFARLQAAALTSSGRTLTGLWILVAATGVGLLAAVTLHFLGPATISTVYGPGFAAAAAYTGILAWMVIPQLVEQPLLALLSTVYAASALTPLYIAGLVVSLAVPVLASMVFGIHAFVPAIVVGRLVSVTVPATLLLKQGGLRVARVDR